MASHLHGDLDAQRRSERADAHAWVALVPLVLTLGFMLAIQTVPGRFLPEVSHWRESMTQDLALFAALFAVVWIAFSVRAWRVKRDARAY